MDRTESLGAPETHTCPLCGGDLDDCEAPGAGEVACSACALSSGCGLRRCPHCGYSLAPSSRLLPWLRKIFGSKEKKNA